MEVATILEITKIAVSQQRLHKIWKMQNGSLNRPDR